MRKCVTHRPTSPCGSPFNPHGAPTRASCIRRGSSSRGARRRCAGSAHSFWEFEIFRWWSAAQRAVAFPDRPGDAPAADVSHCPAEPPPRARSASCSRHLIYLRARWLSWGTWRAPPRQQRVVELPCSQNADHRTLQLRVVSHDGTADDSRRAVASGGLPYLVVPAAGSGDARVCNVTRIGRCAPAIRADSSGSVCIATWCKYYLTAAEAGRSHQIGNPLGQKPTLETVAQRLQSVSSRQLAWTASTLNAWSNPEARVGCRLAVRGGGGAHASQRWTRVRPSWRRAWAGCWCSRCLAPAGWRHTSR